MTKREQKAIEAGRTEFNVELGKSRGAKFDAFQQIASEAFSLVRPAGNWKGPIDAVAVGVDARRVGFIAEAVEFFTGSYAEVTKTEQGWRVRAAGYYAAVGA